MIQSRLIEERPSEHGGRLGRHVEHDERSRAYSFGGVVVAGSPRTVHHRHYGTVLDQDGLGSCTGNAVVQAINTSPLHHLHTHLLHEQEAVDLYSLATYLDPWEGEYPPNDTGSSGLAAAKAAQQKGYITSYQHAFSMEQAIAALQLGPVITGVNWYEGFDHPLQSGLVTIEGQVRGGHEFVIVGYEPGLKVTEGLVFAINSWGPHWGKQGRFFFSVETWQHLLDEDGDVTILVH